MYFLWTQSLSCLLRLVTSSKTGSLQYLLMKCSPICSSFLWCSTHCSCFWFTLAFLQFWDVLFFMEHSAVYIKMFILFYQLFLKVYNGWAFRLLSQQYLRIFSSKNNFIQKFLIIYKSRETSTWMHTCPLLLYQYFISFLRIFCKAFFSRMISSRVYTCFHCWKLGCSLYCLRREFWY